MSRYKVKIKFWKLFFNIKRFKMLLELVIDLVSYLGKHSGKLSYSVIQQKGSVITVLIRELRESKAFTVKEKNREGGGKIRGLTSLFVYVDDLSFWSGEKREGKN